MLQESAALYFSNTGPIEGKINVTALVAATSTQIDLQALVLTEAHTGGQYIEMICDQPLYWKLVPNAGGVADETATAGNDRVMLLPANTIKRFTTNNPNSNILRFLVVKTVLSSMLRLHIASHRLG